MLLLVVCVVVLMLFVFVWIYSRVFVVFCCVSDLLIVFVSWVGFEDLRMRYGVYWFVCVSVVVGLRRKRKRMGRVSVCVCDDSCMVWGF